MLDRLPPELVEQVAMRLSVRDLSMYMQARSSAPTMKCKLMRMFQTCQRLWSVLRDDEFWRERYRCIVAPSASSYLSLVDAAIINDDTGNSAHEHNTGDVVAAETTAENTTGNANATGNASRENAIAKLLRRDPMRLNRIFSMHIWPICRFHIAWINSQYWQRKRHPQSCWGLSACLQSVCWFEVHASLPPMDAGTYKLLLVAGVDSARWTIESLSGVRVTVRAAGSPEPVLMDVALLDLLVTNDNGNRLGDNRWGTHSDSHKLHVVESVQSFNLSTRDGILVRLQNLDGNWKNGLTLDTLMIRRIDSPVAGHHTVAAVDQGGFMSRLQRRVQSLVGSASVMDATDDEKNTVRAFLSEAQMQSLSPEAKTFVYRVMAQQQALIGQLTADLADVERSNQATAAPGPDFDDDWGSDDQVLTDEEPEE